MIRAVAVMSKNGEVILSIAAVGEGTVGTGGVGYVWMSLCMCFAAEPAVLGVCADCSPTISPPANTSVCVFLAKPTGPFVPGSTQVVRLLGLGPSSHTLSVQLLDSSSFSKSQCN